MFPPKNDTLDLDSLYDDPVEEEEPWYKRYWKTANAAPEFIAKPAHELGQSISKWIDPERGTTGMRAMGSAFAESLADTVAGLTSPLNLAATAATGGGYAALKAGMTPVARGLGATAAALNAPGTVEGAQQVFEGEHLDEKLQGLAGATFGMFGMHEGRNLANAAKPKSVGSALPESFGPEAYAGPERRSSDFRYTGPDKVFQDYRDRFARGEDVRSHEAAKFLDAKNKWDAARKKEPIPGIKEPELNLEKDTFVQDKPEVGDIIVDKLGNDHEFIGYDSRGKEVWKLTGEKTAPEVDLDSLYDEMQPQEMRIDPNSFELLDPDEGFGNNASGESEASMEAMNRRKAMGTRNEKFVVYDRAGRRRELIGPEAVDYNPVNGETYGIEGPNGFNVLAHRGGKIPQIDPMRQMNMLKDASTDINRGFKNETVTNRLNKKYEVPEEMRIPGTAVKGGLDNIAMGGASPRVLDVIGTSLYSKDRMTIAAKELLQNSFDELKQSGSKNPIKVGFGPTVNPITGKASRGLVIKDNGRGMTPEQLYTIFTNLGETGKAGVDSASGGFGFAKASPMLGGDFIEVESIVMENGKPVKYTFEGDPKQLKDQVKGVPLKKIHVKEGTKTGLKVKVHYPEDTSSYTAKEYVGNMVRNSQGLPAPVELYSTYNEHNINNFLDTDYSDSKNTPPYGMEQLSPLPSPEIQDTITTPGARVDLKFNWPEAGAEESNYSLDFMNKGLYQHSDSGSYGMNPIPGVPNRIVADIHALVEEGAEGYPFSANREQIEEKLRGEINKWIKKNIIESGNAKRIAKIQKMYDDIQPITIAKGGKSFFALDDGGRLTPEEMELISFNPSMKSLGNKLTRVNDIILNATQKLEWTHNNQNAAERLQKFGLLMKAPEKSGSVTLGIHIPNPGNLDQSAILINVFEHLNRVVNTKNAANRLATGLYTTITHEHAHLPGGGHDTGFAYRHAELLEALDRLETVDILGDLHATFHDPNTGGIDPGLLEVLQKYNDSRKRPASTGDDLIATGIANTGQSNSPGGKGSNGPSNAPNTGQSGIKPSGGRVTPAITAPATQSAMKQLFQLQNAHKMAPKGPVKEGLYRQIRDFNRTLLTSLDLSAPGRQGLPLIAEKEYWNSLGAMFDSMGSQGYYDNLRQMVDSSPLAVKRYQPVRTKNGQLVKNSKTGQAKIKELPSWYEEWGLDLTNTEEGAGSLLAQKIPGVRASNRAYNGFLTKLRFDTFNRMMQDLANSGIDIKQDVNAGKKLAEFINNSTGRGSLGKLTRFAPALNEVFFAPRLMAAKVNRFSQVFRPEFYRNTPPEIRQAALKSLISTAAFGVAFGELARQAGAQINSDPTNSDFRKIRIGDVRIDPFGGDQQYLVAAARMLSGRYVSPADNKNKSKDYFQNIGTTGGRFAINKFSPFWGFGYQLLTGKNRAGEPFSIPQGVVESTVPMILQDITKIAMEDPGLLPLSLLPLLGMSSQVHDRR